MRPVSQLRLVIAHAAVGIFALVPPAVAASIFINMDTTITTNVTGDAIGDGAADAAGGFGQTGITWVAPSVDVIIDPNLIILGGLGGNGGPDAANNGGNIGGAGGGALYLPHAFSTVSTGSGVFIVGGAGGNGSNGGIGGASDTTGGNGHGGGSGIYTNGDDIEINIFNSSVLGGDGGNGGDAGDVAGDAADIAKGGVGNAAGAGIIITPGSNAIVDLVGSLVEGGDGGNGGASLANTVNAGGGAGGAGIRDGATNTSITVGVGSLVKGGDGGAAGTGGTGGAAGTDGAGVEFQGIGASLTNYGTILGSATTYPAAVHVTANTTLIDNYGNIGAASGHIGRGIFLTGATLATLRNRESGSIESSGFGGTIGTTSGGTITTFINEGLIANSGSGEAVVFTSAVGSFTNSGTIQAVGGPALSIFNNAPDTILNDGGLLTSASFGGTVQIWADLGAAGIVFDGGQINNTAGGGSAIRMAVSQLGNIEVKNASILGKIKFDASNETLNVTGSTLNGDIEFTGTGNNLSFLSGGTTTLLAATQFQNATFFSLLAGSSVVSNAAQTGANTAIANMMTVPTAYLTLNEDFWVDEGALNQGTMEIATGKTLTANAVSGNGTYIFGVSGASTLAAVNGQGAGSSLDFTGATLEIKLTDPSAMLVNGVNMQLAEDLNGNAIIGVTNGALLTDNSALLNFLLYRGDAAEIGLDDGLLFAQVQLALLADIAGEGDDPNSIALGAALDEIGLDGDSDLDDLMLALALLPTNEAINGVLDALLPETDGIAYDIATDMGDQVLDITSKRLDQLTHVNMAARETKLASLTPVTLRGSLNEAHRGAGRFWLQGFGRAVEQGRRGYNTGYDAGSAGVALGGDVSVSATTQFGAAFAYADTDADGNGINRTDTEVESYQLVLYGDHVNNEAMYVKAMLGVGWHRNDIARHDVGGIPGNTAGGAYDATQVTARAEAGLAYDGGGTLTLLPRLTANYVYYDADGYSETGVGGLGLTVTPESLLSVRVGLGLLARWDLKLGDSELLQPELRLDYRRDLTRERFETVSEFLGAPGIAFATQGVEPPADILNLGVGALLATAGGVDLRASYDLELKEDYTAHAGYVRASIPF